MLASYSMLLASNDVPKVSAYFSGSKQGVSYYGKHFNYSWTYGDFDNRSIKKWIGGDSIDPPRYVINQLSLTIGNKTVSIPKEAYWDLYDPQVQGAPPYILEDKNYVYMVILLSDGAGSAKALLKFKDGKYIERIIEIFHPTKGYYIDLAEQDG